MAKGQRDNNGGGMEPLMMAVLVALAILLVVLFWYRWHTQIATLYSWLRMGQFALFWAIGEAVSWLSTPFHDWFDFFSDSDRSLIQFSHLSASSLPANIFTCIFVVIPISVWFFRKSLRTNPYNHEHFGRVKDYSLHSFTDRMGLFYPHLKLFRKLNLTARPIDSGKYRMADTEKEFAINYDLLDVVKAGDFKVNRDRSMDVFRQQLGKLWTSYGQLSRFEYALVAMLIPRVAATDADMPDAEYKAALKTTEKLLEGYWRDAADSYDPKKDTITLGLEAARESIRRYGKNPKVVKIIRAHAYVSTIIYALLSEARSLGVLAACDMRWLRVADRRLWLIVDNVGRIVSFTECAGVYCHYLHEAKQRRAIEKPQVDNAVKGLVEEIDKVKFTDEEVEAVMKRKKGEQELEILDVNALALNRQTVFAALAMVRGPAGQQDVFEAAVVNEKGDLVYSARCKPSVPVDAETRHAFALEDADVTALDKAPTAASVKDKVREVCNGHRLVVFQAVHDVVSGIERSAGEYLICSDRPDAGGSSSVFDLAATLQLGLVPPGRRSMVTEAQACRAVWFELEKRAVKASVVDAGSR